MKKYTIKDLIEGNVVLQNKELSTQNRNLFYLIIQELGNNGIALELISYDKYYHFVPRGKGRLISSSTPPLRNLPYQDIKDFELPSEFKWGEDIEYYNGFGSGMWLRGKYIGKDPLHSNSHVITNGLVKSLPIVNIRKPLITYSVTKKDIADMMNIKVEQLNIVD